MMRSGNQRTWMFPRRLLDDFIGLTLLLWVGVVVVVAAVIIGVSAFRTIEISGWEQFAQVAQVYVAFIGGYVAYSMLPLYVTHGQTRRDFAIQGTIFIPIFAAAAAVLMTVGYVLEWVLYSLNNWPQDLQNVHLFTSPTDLPLIFVEFLLLSLTWASAGALVGGAFYRSAEAGFVGMVLALIPITATGIVTNDAWWGPVDLALGTFFDAPVDIPFAASVAISVGGCLFALAMAWRVVRDVPIHTTSS